MIENDFQKNHAKCDGDHPENGPKHVVGLDARAGPGDLILNKFSVFEDSPAWIRIF